jgi:hypothetical protein
MSQIVHVIMPTGTRHERPFPDNATSEKILQSLESVKHLFGFNGTVKKLDGTIPGHAVMMEFGDPNSGYAWDNPATQVVVLKTDDIKNDKGEVTDYKARMDQFGKPIVARWLKGEPKPPEEPTETPEEIKIEKELEVTEAPQEE